MTNERRATHGVMEGRGAYNRHAKLQADGGAVAMPQLEKAIRNVEVSGESPIVIADYGSSQGKNSLSPMKAAITAFRVRIGRERAISVFHVDQPTNDFNSLFELLDTDPARYDADDPNVYPAAIGRSFYESVLPPGSVHIGWSSYAAVWLSRVPKQIPDHFIAVCSAGEVRAAFDRHAAQDWESFLLLRARELRTGGRLIVVLPGVGDDGLSGFEPLFDQANAVLEQMVVDGTITSEERSRMTIGSHPRRKKDLLAPFVGTGQFQNLTVEDCLMSEVTDSAWEQYKIDKDEEILAAKRALFFRSIFVPSLAGALGTKATSNDDARAKFADQVEQRLKRRLASHPAAVHSLVQVIVLVKEPAKD